MFNRLKPKRIKVKCRKNDRIFVIPDMHAPFILPSTISRVLQLVREIKPDLVIQVGDMYDAYTFSRFVGSRDLITPRQEMIRGKAILKKFWKDLQTIVPKAKCLHISGNHEYRLVKNLQSKAPEYEDLLVEPISQLTEFKNVTSLKSSKDELEVIGHTVGSMIFIHGWSTNKSFHVKYFLQSVVHGHSHSPSLEYVRHKNKTLFEMDCGFLGNPDALPFQYRSTRTSKWAPGVGLIDSYGPRVILL